MTQSQSVIFRKTLLQHLWEIGRGLSAFSGRSERTQMVLFLMLLGMIGPPAARGLADLSIFYSVSEKRLEILLMATAIPLFVRRLHDQDRSGWWALIVPALMVVDWAMGTSNGSFPLSVTKFILVMTVWLFVLWPGTDGTNRYGPDPRREHDTAH